MRVALVMILLVLGGCDRWETPWLAIGTVSLSGEWLTMGLPLEGAQIQRSDGTVLQVDIPARTQTAQMQIARKFERALQSYGWEPRETAGDLASSSFRRSNYGTPDGGRALLEVRKMSGAARVTIRRIPPS